VRGKPGGTSCTFASSQRTLKAPSQGNRYLPSPGSLPWQTGKPWAVALRWTILKPVGLAVSSRFSPLTVASERVAASRTSADQCELATFSRLATAPAGRASMRLNATMAARCWVQNGCSSAASSAGIALASRRHPSAWIAFVRTSGIASSRRLASARARRSVRGG
jgi:hypothetical protein